MTCLVAYTEANHLYLITRYAKKKLKPFCRFHITITKHFYIKICDRLAFDKINECFTLTYYVLKSKLQTYPQDPNKLMHNHSPDLSDYASRGNSAPN